MKKISLSLSILLGIAGMILWNRCLPIPTLAPPTWVCEPLPADFRETDLIGVWQRWDYGGDGVATETLTLRADHTYQQKYEGVLPGEPTFYYTSTWNTWYLEKTPTSGLVMHLDKMCDCVYNGYLCRDCGRSIEDFWNPCTQQGEAVPMTEMRLLVVGAADLEHPLLSGQKVPRGFVLVHLMISPDVAPNYFVLMP